MFCFLKSIQTVHWLLHWSACGPRLEERNIFSTEKFLSSCGEIWTMDLPFAKTCEDHLTMAISNFDISLKNWLAFEILKNGLFLANLFLLLLLLVHVLVFLSHNFKILIFLMFDLAVVYFWIYLPYHTQWYTNHNETDIINVIENCSWHYSHLRYICFLSSVISWDR